MHENTFVAKMDSTDTSCNKSELLPCTGTTGMYNIHPIY